MRSLLVCLLISAVAGAAAERRARNVVLFLGDGTGPDTVNAAPGACTLQSPKGLTVSVAI